MPSTYYLGQSPDEALGDSPRYWYALRRNQDGELFLLRSDQLKDKDSIELNLPGAPAENFEDFEPGIDYFEGITSDHEVEYENLVWTQYRWDNRNLLYYVDNQGRLTQRINQGYTYPTGHQVNGINHGRI
jgi:hypothetical protein